MPLCGSGLVCTLCLPVHLFLFAQILSGSLLLRWIPWALVLGPSCPNTPLWIRNSTSVPFTPGVSPLLRIMMWGTLRSSLSSLLYRIGDIGLKVQYTYSSFGLTIKTCVSPFSRLNSHQAQWVLFLRRFNFTLTYRPGSHNIKSDSCQFVLPEETCRNHLTIRVIGVAQ